MMVNYGDLMVDNRISYDNRVIPNECDFPQVELLLILRWSSIICIPYGKPWNQPWWSLMMIPLDYPPRASTKNRGKPPGFCTAARAERFRLARRRSGCEDLSSPWNRRCWGKPPVVIDVDFMNLYGFIGFSTGDCNVMVKLTGDNDQQ